MRSYDLLNAVPGWTECRVTGVEPAAFLNRCAAEGLALLSARAEGEYSLRVTLQPRQLRRARAAAAHSRCELTVLRAGGGPRFAAVLLRRAALVLGLLAMFGVLAWSRLFIWEITVTGNETVPTARILDALRECGVDTGKSWLGITSDNLRSELLIELPELAWATVNIHGSRAEAIVRERTPKPPIWRAGDPFDLLADKTGFVTEVQVWNGTALVKPGSAVVPGDILIAGEARSAYAGTRQTHAAGKVTAQTYYELIAQAPLTAQNRTYTGAVHSRYALLIGKNRYNFYKSSSISPESCVTITSVRNLGIPGLFSLPVSFLRETAREYEIKEASHDRLALRRELEEALHARLLAALGPGARIESERFSAIERGGKLTVTLRAQCLEQIGTERERN